MEAQSIERLLIRINCSNMTPDEFSTIFASQEMMVHDDIEKFKRDRNISRIQGESFPLIINLDNRMPNDILTIKIDLDFTIKASSSTQSLINESRLIEFSYPYELGSGKYYNGLLFDISGFDEVLVKVNSVNYNNTNGEAQNNFKSNTPLLINTTDLSNPYHGYRSQEEMVTYFLLQNYVQSSLTARTLLVGIMFKALKEIAANRTFEFGDYQISYGDQQVPTIMNMIQMDIISKLMMYIEDLITLLIAMRDCDGNFYGLLDKTAEFPDLGGRINEFLDNVHALTPEQWRKMLSYANPDEIKPENPLVAKLIKLNIEGFKKVFEEDIRNFRNTHIRIFRRYKHGGLPVRPGFIYSDYFPLTSRKFDSYSIVPVGPDPLVDVVPVPYSKDVIESYHILLERLETRISDVVENKIECIRQRKNGVIPQQNYSPKEFSSAEHDEIVSAIDRYDIQYPNRSYYDFYNLKFSADNAKEMKWYVDLENNMKKWKQQDESHRELQ